MKRMIINQQLRREWIILSVALLLLAAFLGFHNGLGRLDLTLYDKAIQLNGQPARDDIIIVAIDDYSINQLGAWPWPRERHAQLIHTIAQANPLAIGMDVVFTEKKPNPDGTDSVGDTALANAIAENNRSVIPLILENSGAGLVVAPPYPSLAATARTIGHINLEVDNDGIARSVFLREGRGGEWWPHFSLAMYNIIKQRPTTAVNNLPGARIPDQTDRSTPSNPDSWQRDFQLHIPYYGIPGHFKSVPYVSVLRGEIPAQFFTGKSVLIGATATGMADGYSTPTSGLNGAMPGIEINANILASLLDNRSISLAPPELTVLFSLIPVMLALVAYLWLSPRLSLALAFLLLLIIISSSYFLLIAGYWIPPSAGLIVVALTYPLWSWLRLEAAIRYLGQEFTRLNNEPHLLPEPDQQITQEKQRLFRDPLEQRILAMKKAAQRVRDLRQFVTDSLHSLPDATLVTTIDGHVILFNPTAKAYFASIGLPHIADALLPYLFAGMTQPTLVDANGSREFSWWDLLDQQHTTLMKSGIEVMDKTNRDLIIKSAPCTNAGGELIGWIISVTDISAIRSAERSRDETLHFISHDMRAPQASILALIELQQFPASALEQTEFLSRIEKACHITLGLADNFVHLARAESANYQLEIMDFQDVVLDSCDEMWAMSKSKNITIKSSIPDGEYPVNLDRSLITRALTNLISNAIKYSPRDTCISISLEFDADPLNECVICHINDQGYGIARSDQPKLFQRFQRFVGENQPTNDGVGLGMVFVKAVMDRHQAQISFTSAVNQGTKFTIRIPAYMER